ncbi:lipopolysaccharide biosynthesis protein [Blastomonas fulva]|uniref:lipopolysaccharide biosynthesis protein n=1 Tax=Blastomonas fulva TaxID=1550728 RepID=UPI003D2B6378
MADTPADPEAPPGGPAVSAAPAVSRASAVSRTDVASGAALSGLARMGAVIEIITQPAFVWMFGLATYGTYIVLWAAVNLLATLTTLSLAQGLQRSVPAAPSREAEHGAVRYALLVTVIPSALLALAISLAAPWIAPAFAVGPEMRAALPQMIALFIWTLPLTVALEIATAAARAKRAFGPEIRLRIFWEQIARLIVAVALYALGVRLFGLFIAHIASLAITAWLSVRLLGRYYDLALLWRAPMPPALRRDTLKSGLATMPPNLARRAFNDLPPVLLGLALSGAGGAVAAGLFGIARKIASVPLIVRQTFLYVLAPLSAAQSAADPAEIAPLYRFANRLAAIVVLPLTGVMIAGGDALLLLFSPQAAAALPVLIVLLVGRAGETILGAATPIVEMTGHRMLPLANSLAGIAIAALVGWLTVPTLGATGMALAVSAGVVVSSWSAVVELWWSNGLGPFDSHFVRALACGVAGLAALWLIGVAFGGLHMALRAALQFALFFPLVWLGLKLGLDAEDKAALGKAGRTLRI